MTRQRVDLTTAQVEHLKTLVTGLVSTNESVLDQHGRDESAFSPVRPSAVVMPHSTEEVAQVLAYCNQEKIPVVAFGALGVGDQFLFGGISLLIMVGVGLDTVKQIESQLQQSSYEGFLKQNPTI